MGEGFGDAIAPDDTPPLAPIDHAIDLEHLARMTMGEHKLEREVLTLFDRQAAMLLARMHDAAPTVAAAFAHTLKGSALGIGAWRVAEAADAVELVISEAPAAGSDSSLARLVTAVEEVKAEIAAMLHLHRRY